MRIPQKMTFSEAEQESGQQFGRDPCSLTNMRQNIAFLKEKNVYVGESVLITWLGIYRVQPAIYKRNDECTKVLNQKMFQQQMRM